MHAGLLAAARLRRRLLPGAIALVIIVGALASPLVAQAAPRSVSSVSPGVSAGTSLVAVGAQAFAGARVTFSANQVRLTINGTTRTVATDTPARLDPLFAQLATVSPDGSTLLYVTGDGESMQNATFTTVNLTTLHRQVIAQLGNTFWIHAPRWSPDSKSIAYGRENLATYAPELWVMDATGAHQRLVATGGSLTHRSFEGREANAPSWSADGKSLVFYDSAYKPQTQWSVSVATGARSSVALQTAAGASPSCPSAPTGGDSIRPLCYYGPGCWNVPIYAQNNQYYSNDLMKSANQTIGGYGCALTSLTMLFDYFGSTVGDPRGMNNCLSPWGYADGLNWYGAQVNPPNGPGCDRYTTNFISMPGFSWSNLNYYLQHGWPVIVGICYDGSTCNSTHFFVVVYGDGSNNEANYYIDDPWNGVQQQMSAYAGDHLGWTVLYQSASGTHSPPCE